MTSVSVPVPICFACTHLHEGIGTMECNAFPDGIPDAILDSEADHRLPYPGDHDIRFEQRPDRPEPDPLVFEGEP